MKEDNLNIVTIILHYNNGFLTQKYVENLKSLNWEEIEHHVVVVDNCSPDHSGLYLEKHFEKEADVIVIQNKENLGFAKGNNVGIQYAKKFFDPDLYIISNNDVFIDDILFPKKIKISYLQNNFDCLGPDIYCLRKSEHQNPFKLKPIDQRTLKIKIVKDTIRYYEVLVIKYLGLYDLISKIKRKTQNKSEKQYQNQSCLENVVLHGSFFVLSKQYIAEYPDGLFPFTFLYMEEDILYYRCKWRNLKILYDPTISIIHFDGVASSDAVGNKCNKYLFELKHTIRSCKVFIKYLEENGNI